MKNVKWIWTTNVTNHGEGATLTGNYPGDEYVDYISIDGYNWGKSQSWSSWKSFAQVFDDAYKALANIDKPIFYHIQPSRSITTSHFPERLDK